jgi:putative ABC transport system permease protein
MGNTMSGITLGLDKLTQSVSQQRALLETPLMLGHTWSEAISDIRRDSGDGLQWFKHRSERTSTN